MIAGRYTLEREVGRGGMGAVWLARDEVLGRAVALKRIGMAPGGDTADLERAAREARLAAMLNHPHVVAVFDLVTEDDQQWLVMEYVESLTLAQLVRREGPLSPASAAPLLLQAADALAAAHAAGIVHRDVKPSNILVTEQGRVKLSDFGIARAEADASLTQTGLVTGSPAYLAPEVASGQVASDASDVWSLGATCFHALAGHPPYDVTGNLMGALYRIVNEEPPRLSEAGPLAPLLEATMARDPAERWSMAKVKEFLAHVCATQNVSVPAGVVASPATPPRPTAADDGHTLSQPAVVDPTPFRPTAAALPVAPAPDPSRQRRRSWLAPLAAAVVLGLVVLVGWLALTGNDDDDPEPDRAAIPSDTAPERGKETESSSAPSPTANEPDAAEMEAFVVDYLATVTADPEVTWERLTPEFQDASGGFGSYSGFWRTIAAAEATQVSADTDAMTVTYSVEYTEQNGERTSDEVTLKLVQQEGEYLIAQELG
ncbi:serine/threonine-protein kinase [Nocardioides pacificus]